MDHCSGKAFQVLSDQRCDVLQAGGGFSEPPRFRRPGLQRGGYQNVVFLTRFYQPDRLPSPGWLLFRFRFLGARCLG